MTDANPGDAAKIARLIPPDRTVLGLRVASKPQLLKELARRAAAETGLEEQAILDVLAAREALGSTGVGAGIAMPHGRLPGLAAAFGLLAKLERPIDYDAIDGQPVDLAVMLLSGIGDAANAEHLASLACLSRRLRDATVAKRIRRATDAAAIHALLVGSGGG